MARHFEATHAKAAAKVHLEDASSNTSTVKHRLCFAVIFGISISTIAVAETPPGAESPSPDVPAGKDAPEVPSADATKDAAAPDSASSTNSEAEDTSGSEDTSEAEAKDADEAKTTSEAEPQPATDAPSEAGPETDADGQPAEDAVAQPPAEQGDGALPPQGDQAALMQELEQETQAAQAALEKATAGLGATTVGTESEAVQAELEVAPEADSAPFIGLGLDIGVPDGVNVAAIYRPFYWLRGHAGLSHNVLALGVRAGVSLIAFDYWVTPVGVAEVGHYFDGNAASVIEQFSGETVESSILEKVAYDYANLHLGLEFGGDWFTFFLRGGMSFARSTIHAEGEDFGGQISFPQNPGINGHFPSAKLGFAVYVY